MDHGVEQEGVKPPVPGNVDETDESTVLMGSHPAQAMGKDRGPIQVGHPRPRVSPQVVDRRVRDRVSQSVPDGAYLQSVDNVHGSRAAGRGP